MGGGARKLLKIGQLAQTVSCTIGICPGATQSNDVFCKYGAGIRRHSLQFPVEFVGLMCIFPFCNSTETSWLELDFFKSRAPRPAVPSGRARLHGPHLPHQPAKHAPNCNFVRKHAHSGQHRQFNKLGVLSHPAACRLVELAMAVDEPVASSRSDSCFCVWL